MLKNAFSKDEVKGIADDVQNAILHRQGCEGEVLGNEGGIYAVRNLTDVWPGLPGSVMCSALKGVLQGVLGGAPGLVRAIYFDKPELNVWHVP